MKTKHIYLCDNSIDGIFSAIYAAYESNYGHNNNSIMICDGEYNREIFSDYIDVATDYDKALKVAHTISSKISPQALTVIQRASASYDIDKANAIYQVVVLGLAYGPCVLDQLTQPAVLKLFTLDRNVNNEIMHLNGFLRFKELRSHALFAKINPKNNILPYLANHFTDRFPEENWAIADTVHQSAIFHKKHEGSTYLSLRDVNLDELVHDYSDDELFMQKLWKHFVDTIAIESRVNTNLQRQNLPIRFRKYMSEFN